MRKAGRCARWGGRSEAQSAKDTLSRQTGWLKRYSSRTVVEMEPKTYPSPRSSVGGKKVFPKGLNLTPLTTGVFFEIIWIYLPDRSDVDHLLEEREWFLNGAVDAKTGRGLRDPALSDKTAATYWNRF